MRQSTPLWCVQKKLVHKKNKGKSTLGRYIVRRLLYLIPILFGVTLLSYGLMYLSPQGPVEMMLQAEGIAADEDLVASMKEQLGLDRPFLMQYLSWISDFVRGDLGKSYIDGAEVSGKLLSALPNTLILTLSSVLATVIFSLPLGILCALKKDKWTDKILRFLSFLGNSLPNFIVSLLLLYFLALKLHLFPVLSNGSPVSYVLPTMALSIPMIGKYIRQVRSSILEEWNKPYVAGALSRGISKGRVLISYVLPCAFHTLLTLLSLSIGSLLGGTAAVEIIFSLPGLGYMITSAVLSRDYPVIQAFVVWMGLIYILINLVTDIISFSIDPRLSGQMEVKS